MKYTLFTVIFIIIGNLVSAQGLKGRIVDSKKQPVPFATIYIENLQSGTTANQNGEFEIKCDPGKYSVLFRALGFKMQKKQIDINQALVNIDIILETEVYQMKEVIISNKREDPAYAVMRKAIAYAPYHLREVDHFNSSVYLKGTLIVDKMPKLLQKYARVDMNGEQFSIKSGDVYVEESVIDMEFNAPQFYKRKVKSIRSSFPGENQNPVNPVMTIESSFYRQEVMDAISPLSPQAFQHYKFRYLGFTEDGEYSIDKIEVIPRRKSQDLFEGFIYIVEGKWCLYSLDLINTQFWGSVNIKEIFSIVDGKAWLPISYSLAVNAKMMGVKARYKYASSVRYSNIRINEKLAAQYGRANTSKEKSTEADKVSQILAKENLSNREMRKAARAIDKKSQYQMSDTLTTQKFMELNKRETDSLATKRDTSYWANYRPIPLTSEEIKSFNEGPQSVMQKVKRDSIRQKQDTTANSKKKSIFWVFTGKTFRFNEKKSWVNYGGLIQPDQFSFNTVDGFRYGLTSSLSLRLDSFSRLRITPWVGYAFDRKAFMWSIRNELTYGRAIAGKVGLNIGEESKDFSGVHGMPVFMNTVYSLFLRENYKKFYNSKYLEIYNGINLSRAFRLNTAILYEKTNELRNYSDYSFFYKNSKQYSPNSVTNTGFFNTIPTEFTNLISSITLIYTPQHRFWRGNYRDNADLFPRVDLTYESGISGVLGSDSKYNKLSLGLSKRKWLPRDRYFEYNVKYTQWLSSQNVHFSKYSHVNTYNFPLSFSALSNKFQFLPYYMPSTTDWLVTAHVRYSTNLLILKRLPIISNRIWDENIYFNYMHSNIYKHHVELGYGLGKIFALCQIGVFSAFDNGKYSTTGLRISIGGDN